MVLLKRLNPFIHSNNQLWRLFTSDSFMVSLRFLIFNVLCHTKCISIPLWWFNPLPYSISSQTILLLLWCIFFLFFYISSRSCSSFSFGFVEIAFSIVFEALVVNSIFCLILRVVFCMKLLFLGLNIVDSLKVTSLLMRNLENFEFGHHIMYPFHSISIS